MGGREPGNSSRVINNNTPPFSTYKIQLLLLASLQPHWYLYPARNMGGGMHKATVKLKQCICAESKPPQSPTQTRRQPPPTYACKPALYYTSFPNKARPSSQPAIEHVALFLFTFSAHTQWCRDADDDASRAPFINYVIYISYTYYQPLRMITMECKVDPLTYVCAYYINCTSPSAWSAWFEPTLSHSGLPYYIKTCRWGYLAELTHEQELYWCKILP